MKLRPGMLVRPRTSRTMFVDLVDFEISNTVTQDETCLIIAIDVNHMMVCVLTSSHDLGWVVAETHESLQQDGTMSDWGTVHELMEIA